LIMLALPPQLTLAEESRFFPETSHTVSGKFLQYWEQNGGLPVFGYPLTEAQNEVDPETGQTFLTQWFERNRFELHPENAGTKYEVLLGLLGKDLRREALTVDPDFQRTSMLNEGGKPVDNLQYFPLTGHNLRGIFLAYWQTQGGLERFGLPISEEHVEVDPITGHTFTVQWFERARFEYHPENQPPYDVLLGLLGVELKNPSPGLHYQWKIDRRTSDSLQRPTQLALDSQGHLIVGDSQDISIQKYSQDGHLLSKWGSQGTENGQFQGIGAVALDSSDNIYVADAFASRIQKFNSNGQFLKAWDTGSAPAQGIAVDKTGNLYAYGETGGNGNYHPAYVRKYSPVGKLLKEWHDPQAADKTFFNISAIAVDSHNQIFIVGPTLEKFNTQGELLASWNINDASQNQVIYTGSLVVDSHDYLYLVDTRLGFKADNPLVPDRFIEGRIRKYDGDGRLIRVFSWDNQGKADGQLNQVSSLVVDPQDAIYVADPLNQRIQKFRT
ncbi:MAG TPA: hypothetical protein VH186_07540, partial [Chloroflexia bacterium]|nr:hypothetical protein [Chloroflexia bacterium]